MNKNVWVLFLAASLSGACTINGAGSDGAIGGAGGVVVGGDASTGGGWAEPGTGATAGGGAGGWSTGTGAVGGSTEPDPGCPGVGGFTGTGAAPSEGGSTSPDPVCPGAGGIIVGTGGSTAPDPACSGGADSGGASSGTSYQRGGYAGAQNIVGPDGQELQGDLGYYACDGRVVSVYDTGALCEAASLCTFDCATAADCPSIAGGPVAECRASSEGTPVDHVCALPCTVSDECPADMVCAEDSRFGRMCMFPDVRWEPHCPSYCSDTEEECGEGVPCCGGLVCAPWGVCEARECLPFGFECGEGSPGCCDGLTCRDGVCQTN